jgi:hypothetical protein
MSAARQAVKLHATEVALVDAERLKALAVALVGTALELAGTAIITIAMAEGLAFDQPVDPCQVALPRMASERSH